MSVFFKFSCIFADLISCQKMAVQHFKMYPYPSLNKVILDPKMTFMLKACIISGKEAENLK